MQVVCDNCAATYKIPEHKLVKEVNKATCRKCGHRMLIRKPKAGSSAGGFQQAARAAASAASVPRPSPPPTSEWEEEDPTQIAQFDAQGEPQLPPTPAPQVPPPQVAAPAPEPPAPAAPRVPAPSVPQPTPQVAAPAPQPAAPAPSISPAASAPAAQPAPQVTTARAAAPAHDPSGDMTLVALGAVLAVIGALMLAVNVSGGMPLRFGGLFLGLWGGLVALFLVVTSSRGRKPASKVLSLILGTVFAIGGAGLISVVAGGAMMLEDGLADLEKELDAAAAAAPADEDTIDALFAEDGDAAAEATADPAEPAGEAIEPEPEPEPEAAPEPEPEPVRAAEPARTAQPARSEPSRDDAYVAPARTSPPPSSSATSSRTSEPARSTSSGSSSSSRTTAPASTSSGSSSSSDSSSGGAKGGMATLPPTVVDTMLKSNKNVKKCMYQEYKRSDGNLGSVTIRFKVLPSGKVSSAYVTTSRYKGTELDSCLSAALYTVQFPPFSGEAVTLNWTAAAN